jgi:hypothetical protein
MNKEQMDLKMIEYLQTEETSVKRSISDLEGTISTFKDSDKVSSLPDVVTSQAVPNIPHWESELELLHYKLEWLESQIYYFGEDARQKESLKQCVEELKKSGKWYGTYKG